MLHIDTDVADSIITAELIGDGGSSAALDSDHILIARIKNKSQKIRITASKDGYNTVTKVYTLAGLILE